MFQHSGNELNFYNLTFQFVRCSSMNHIIILAVVLQGYFPWVEGSISESVLKIQKPHSRPPLIDFLFKKNYILNLSLFHLPCGDLDKNVSTKAARLILIFIFNFKFITFRKTKYIFFWTSGILQQFANYWFFKYLVTFGPRNTYYASYFTFCE